MPPTFKKKFFSLFCWFTTSRPDQEKMISFMWESGDKYIQLSRSNTARGSCTGLVTVVPTYCHLLLWWNWPRSVDSRLGYNIRCTCLATYNVSIKIRINAFRLYFNWQRRGLNQGPLSLHSPLLPSELTISTINISLQINVIVILT